MAVLKKVDFKSLDSPELQKLFEDIKDAFQKMCPIKDELSELYSENFAFDVTRGIQTYFNKFEERIMKEVDAKIAAAGAANPRVNMG
jgi:hypothetical protein